jgi:hypothetical protein
VQAFDGVESGGTVPDGTSTSMMLPERAQYWHQ